MKKVLSVLMCFVFLQAQTFALRGGPGSVGGGERVSGAYSGVMIESSGASDLGMFLLAAVGNGASSGQVVIFSSNFTPASTTTTGGVTVTTPQSFDSDTYFGALTGLSDTSRGGSGNFTGIFNGTASTGNASARSVSGQLSLRAVRSVLTSGTQRLIGTGSSRTVSVVTTVLGGNNASSTGPLRNYIVDGWLTSSSSVGASFSIAN